MFDRPFWAERLATGWKQASIVCLTGPRRVGKTVLAQSVSDAEFLNCDLPGVAERLRDPESFYRVVTKRLVVFDEVHQLPDPSRLLKIGADGLPQLKILATGCSTLAATSKFRDSLTGRKRVVELVPVLYEELPAFAVVDVRERLLRGGLPPALLTEELNPEFYSEWMDSYFARDVQELFRLEKRAGFLRLLELLFRQSGGMLDVTRLAAETQVSRPTVTNWLEVYQTTHVVHLVRPFAAGLPKIHFWRDKQHREVDFVVPRGRDAVDAIECKWKPDAFEARGLAAFRALYPKGRNYVVSPLSGPSHERSEDGHRLVFVSPGELRQMIG